MTPPIKPCSATASLAKLEELLGFPKVARSLSEKVAMCRQGNGPCAAPYACGAHRPMPAAPNILRFTNQASNWKFSAVSPSRTIGATVLAFDPATEEGEVDPQGNSVDAKLLDIDLVRTRGDELSDMLSYWESLSAEGIPNFSDLDPAQLGQIGLLHRLHVVDASNRDPREMRFDLFAPGAGLDKGRDLRGTRIVDYPVKIYANQTMADYNMVRLAGAPRYQRVRSRLNGVGYRYRRLILPFTTDHRRVDRLITAVALEPGSGSHNDSNASRRSA